MLEQKQLSFPKKNNSQILHKVKKEQFINSYSLIQPIYCLWCKQLLLKKTKKQPADLHYTVKQRYATYTWSQLRAVTAFILVM